jgi:hypothetical protein
LNGEKDAEAYLREVASSIDFLNKKAQEKVFKCGLDVLTEVLALKKYANRRVRETRDIARQEFLAGVQRYLIGFFEDSSAHKCSLIVFRLISSNEACSWFS